MLLRCQLPFRVRLAQIYHRRRDAFYHVTRPCREFPVHSSSMLEMNNKGQANRSFLLPTSSFLQRDGDILSQTDTKAICSLPIPIELGLQISCHQVPKTNHCENLALYHAKKKRKEKLFPLCLNSNHKQIIRVYLILAVHPMRRLLSLLAGGP